MSEYTEQAKKFLDDISLSMRLTEYPADMQEPPKWAEDAKPIRTEAGPLAHGLRYRVTLSRQGKPGRIAFDFWGSINDRAKRKHPKAYDVLACISSDIYCPETFKDFCAEYGYELDSRKALATWKRCAKFAKRLRAFFSESEIEQLSEIR